VRFLSNRAAPLFAIAITLGMFALMFWSFVAGIQAALDGSGSGPGGWVALFFASALVAIATMGFALVGVIRAQRKALWIIAFCVSLLPLAGIVAAVIASRF
jgi:hypothetical protein